MNYTDEDVQVIVDTQVELKTKELQQRIDKAIELCNIVIKNEPLQINPNEELLDQIYGIKELLSVEEVKDNEK